MKRKRYIVSILDSGALVVWDVEHAMISEALEHIEYLYPNATHKVAMGGFNPNEISRVREVEKMFNES